VLGIVTTSTGRVLEAAPNLHWVSGELLSKNQIPGSDIYIYVYIYTCGSQFFE